MSESVDGTEDKPMLLKAIELVLADPAEIKKECFSLQQKFQKKYLKISLLMLVMSNL